MVPRPKSSSRVPDQLRALKAPCRRWRPRPLPEPLGGDQGPAQSATKWLKDLSAILAALGGLGGFLVQIFPKDDGKQNLPLIGLCGFLALLGGSWLIRRRLTPPSRFRKPSALDIGRQHLRGRDTDVNLPKARWTQLIPILDRLIDQSVFITTHFSWRPSSPDAMNARAIVVTSNLRDFQGARDRLGLPVLLPVEFVKLLVEMAGAPSEE